MISLRSALLVAALLAGAVLAWQWRSSPEGSSALPTAAPLAAVTSPPASSMPTGSTPPVATPSLQQLPQASGPAPVAAPGVGSEGYGPHIERAQASSDPQHAWDAVKWLNACAVNEISRQSAETIRNQGVAPEFMTQRMVELDAEARRCQTVTAQHRAMAVELTLRAMRGGVAGAAAAYAAATQPATLATANREEVVAAMRRDAVDGQPNHALDVAMTPRAWGLSDAERLTYLYVYSQLGGQSAKAMTQALLAQGAIPFRALPTRAQLEEAEAEGEQILGRFQTNKQP